MPKDSPYRPFTPNPDMVARRPDVAGNAINGLGEPDVRQPEMVFWAPDPDDIAFGDVQKWFYMAQPPSEAMAETRRVRQAAIDKPLPPLAAQAVDQTPENWTRALDQFVASGACEMVGVAAMRPEWVFEGQAVAFKNIIVLGVQHNYDVLKLAPEFEAGVEVTYQYGRAAAVSKDVACWLREQGWDAEPAMGPMAGKVLMIPPALECGFGELGKHGSLINPEFGAAFRLSAVLTDAPFALTPKRDFGIDEFCSNCRICEDACPPFAIEPDKQTVRGAEKWYVDFDKCIPFFAENSGCAICIAQCPWPRPGVGMNLAAKLAKRAERIAD